MNIVKVTVGVGVIANSKGETKEVKLRDGKIRKLILLLLVLEEGRKHPYSRGQVEEGKGDIKIDSFFKINVGNLYFVGNVVTIAYNSNFQNVGTKSD